jgi:hypothetical protein
MNISFDYKVVEKGKNAPEYDIKADLDGELTLADLLQFTKASLITIATDVLREEQGRGFDKEPTQIVDGVRGRPLELVNPLGKIQFVASQDLAEIALFTWDNISKRSPVDTGLYVSQNIVSYNGKVIASSREELELFFSLENEFGERDRIRFINAAPYAHKLERYARTKGSKSKIQTRKSKDPKQRSGPRVLKPNGAYTLAHRAVKRKFGRNVFTKFELLPGDYIGVTSPLPPNGKQKFRTTYDPLGKYNKGYYIYPTILLGVESSGLTNLIRPPTSVTQ